MRQTSDVGRLLTANEAAQILRIHLVTLYSWVSEGRIPSIKLGRKRLFDESALRKWITHQSEPVITELERRPGRRA